MRLDSAKYNDNPISAVEIDDDIKGKYDRTCFTCINCGVKISFNRGTDKIEPHFKNWINIEH